MTTPLPFPSSAAGIKGQQDHSQSGEMRIDIPKSKDEAAAATTGHHAHFAATRPTKSHTPGSAHPSHHDASNANSNAVGVPPRGSSHHPRPPLPGSDSYFPNSNSASATGPGAPPPRTPGSVRHHSRQPSTGSIAVPSAIPAPGSARKQAGAGGQNMTLSLSAGGQQANGVGPGVESFADFGGIGHNGPPSPSTLTDIILGLHSTLYGGKRTAEEVREMVYRYYDRDAIFESPLLAALGREQIANQFIMAFTLPGMDVKSELRDVICSDFEFDGTRAGIIDQTISVTFLPSLFGSSASETGGQSSFGSAFHSQHHGGDVHHDRGGSATPAYTLQSAITPHPFATYSSSHTPAQGSMFSRYASQSHSPTTPYSVSGMWGTSRPHTPGNSSHIRPLSQSHRPSTPPSVNGEDDDLEHYGNSTNATVRGEEEDETHYMSVNEAGGGQVSRPAMPADALMPHWSAQGLGRSSVRALLWGIFHPRAVLKHMCTINLRLMSRLEFNDAGLIVRHEDTWGVRETIEGVVPFASLIYAIERRVVGYICSFAIGRGFRLSKALTHHAIGSSSANDSPSLRHRSSRWSIGGDQKGDTEANEAARLLLGYHRHEKMQSMARSRAASPSRHRFSIHGGGGSSAHSASGRSRARSIVGGPHSAAPTRAASSDNLLSIAYGTSYGERERTNTHGGETLPPDSSARYRTGSRRITTSTASAPIGLGASVTGALDGAWQQGDLYHGALADGMTAGDAKARAPDRDGH